MPCSSTRCPDRPPYVPFPLTAGRPLMGYRSGCANSPSGLRSDGTGWPGHPLCCGCLPCARSPIPSILVPCHGCLSCLAAPCLLVCCACTRPSQCGSRVLCVCVAPPPVCWRSRVPLLCTPLSHPPAPPYADFTSPYDVVPGAVCWSRPCCHPHGGHLPGRRGTAPALVEFVGTSWREGGACLLMARSACAAFGGCCCARTSWSAFALL